MEKLKIWFTDFWPEWKDENFITPILSKHFEIVLDQKNPDVLFHFIFNGMRDTSNYKCKKILFLGENWRPTQFKSDYSISFDPHSETNFRLPLWQVFLLMRPELKDRLYNRLIYKEEQFERWCAFTVSNPSNFIRNGVFQMLNTYKRVHSYGRYLTNDLGLQQTSQGKYWRDAKDEFFIKHPHKFMIAYENTSYRYYCTEKLMDAFLVGATPIYWGDPRVGEDWNEKAFINVTKYDGDVLRMIKEIDNDEGVFKTIYNEHIFTEEQKKKLEDNLNNFEKWLIEKVNN